MSESSLDLVCCSILYDIEIHGSVEHRVEEYWLFNNPDGLKRLGTRLYFLRASYTLVAFAAEAEASSIISMGLDPLMFPWMDLYLEYRNLQNHNYHLLHGKQYIDGQIKQTAPFGEKGKQNLAAVYYKLCGKLIDTKHKDEMRQLIIHGTPEEIELNREHIQNYCTSDVLVLPEILEETKKQYVKMIPRRDPYGYFDGDQLGMVKQESRWRAETAVRTAKMVRHGYPINIEWARNLTENIPHIMTDIIQDINAQFPDIMPFVWNKRKFYKTKEVKEEAKYSMNQSAVKAWIKKNHKLWPVTPSGDISLKLENWEAEYSFRHDFPRGNFGAQMVRYLKTAQSLKGFKDKGGASNNTFWDHVGSDGMVRSYLNPYGAQSSRYQPGSVGFLFLKSAWQRALCQAPQGWVMGAIDFSSQEILLGAILSGDKKLYAAYCSGDVYLAYGKEIGVIPPEGTKNTHEKERDDQKPVLLGWQYWITGHGLSKQLRNQTGNKWEPEDAQKLLDKLDDTYNVFADFRIRMVDMYQSHRHLKLLDGWYMWGDNPSERSTANCWPQGMGGVIARKFVQLAQDAGLNVTFPLHDAGYIMYKSDDTEAMSILAECMKEAFVFYFKGWQREWAKSIRLDAKAWSNDYEEGEFITKTNLVVKTSKTHIDKRALVEYRAFEKYFKSSTGQNLL